MIDLTEHIPWCIAAHGKDKNVLILIKLDSPFERTDGKRVSYQLNHRWLSLALGSNATEEEALACVQGSESTYWSRRELQAIGCSLTRPKNLFDHFDLF